MYSIYFVSAYFTMSLYHEFLFCYNLGFKLTCPPTHQPGCMVGGTVVTLPPSVVVKACGDTEQIRANMGTEIPSCSAGTYVCVLDVHGI